ncbi:MAG: DUF1917 domain-containing protein [Candidatus Micrarchaeota archaeon]|nr:DUF1917 domain-containing protein [Candidatus Micrarchaeota archaeon]
MCNVPSQCDHKEWLWIFNGDFNQAIFQFHECIKNPFLMGRWLIFVNREKVDELWGRLQAPTVLGQLGVAIEASSKLHADLYSKKHSHVLSVYVHSSKDKANVKKVRESLRSLGVFWKLRFIPYLDSEIGNSEGAKSIYYE